MPDTAIKAVLWDFGGVILSSPFEAFNRYEAANGLPRNFLRQVNATNPDDNAWARLERGDIAVDAFGDAFAAESETLGHRVDGRDVLGLLHGEIRPAMVAVLHAVAGRYRTACLTNNVRGAGPESERHAEIAAVMAVFDEVIESSRVGLRKPDPRFYRLACEQLGVTPEESVFLDDLGINLKPARAMGMRTIKVVDPEVAIAELEGHLGHALR
jgi:putative hydrolase of the HAD superfamily